MTRSVVQVGTPAPKKSWSSVQIGQSSVRAVARIGQSSGSRASMRDNACCRRLSWTSSATGRHDARKGLKERKCRAGCVVVDVSLREQARQIRPSVGVGNGRPEERH